MVPLLTWNIYGNGSVKGDVSISEVILNRRKNCYVLEVGALVQVMQNLDSILGTVLEFF